jgi:hypothetical protein
MDDDKELVTVHVDGVEKGRVHYSFLENGSVVSISEPKESFEKYNIPCIAGEKFYVFKNSGMIVQSEFEVMKKILEERSIYLI